VDLPPLRSFGPPEEEDNYYPGLTRLSSIAHPEVPSLPIVTEDVYKANTYTKAGSKFLNEYEILETLGEGSYGKVKKVQRTYLDSQGHECSSIYAIKVLPTPSRSTTG
jgi:serine/threonine protein kinase